MDCFSPLKGAEKKVRIDFYRSERAHVEFVTDSGVEKVPGGGLVLEMPEAGKMQFILRRNGNKSDCGESHQ